MQIKRVAIIGMGAVGAYVLWGLSNRDDIEICVVADGDRADRLRNEGIVINDVKYNPVVISAKEATNIDLVIVSLKYNSLSNALGDIKTVANESTMIMSFMNGVDSEEIIGEAVGMDKMIYSVIKVASERNGNSVRFDPETTIGIIYGEKDEAARKDRTEAIGNLFENTGLHYRCSEHIVEEIWGKFLLNVGNNLIQAIVGCGVGGYTDSKHLAFLKQKLREEVIAIANAKGIDIRLIDASSMVGSKVKPRARYSTLQDIDAGRHTEIDMFSGTIVRMGKELNIPTPYNEYTYHMIKALEEKNDGMFDYK